MKICNLPKLENIVKPPHFLREDSVILKKELLHTKIIKHTKNEQLLAKVAVIVEFSVLETQT